MILTRTGPKAGWPQEGRHGNVKQWYQKDKASHLRDRDHSGRGNRHLAYYNRACRFNRPTFIEQNWVSPPGWCLGVANDAAAGQVIQWACDGKSDQTWQWGSENGFTGYYELVNGGGDCLGLSGGGTIAGTPVISGACQGRADQYWRTAAECVRMTSHGNVDYWPLFSYAASSKGLYVIGSLAGTTKEGADMLLEGYITACDFQFWDGLPDPLI